MHKRKNLHFIVAASVGTEAANESGCVAAWIHAGHCVKRQHPFFWHFVTAGFTWLAAYAWEQLAVA